MPLNAMQRRAIARRPNSVPQSLPVPITGWNTRDSLNAMDPTDAVTLDNWYPDAGGVVVRKGFEIYVTGLGSVPVRTLAEFWSQSARKFIGCCGGAIWDISNAVLPVSLASGFASDAWQTLNFNNHLFFFNGANTPRIYDGTTVSATGFTGLTQSDLIGGTVYKNRLYLIARNSSSFWYGGLYAITGTLTEFPLSMVSALGGNLLAITTMSHDGGDGVQDFIVFIMASGEVIIYNGDDPNLSTNWALVGRYRISPPVNIRAVARYGAESFLTTFDDHVPLQQQLVALKLGAIPPRSKISGAAQAAVSANENGFGWQALYYTKGRRLIFNIPNVNGTFDQHVYNTSTDAWCRFTGMNSQCWGLYQNDLYFGTDGGTVCLADVGSMDNTEPVEFDGQPAWNMLESPTRKRVAAVKPVLQSSGGIDYGFGVGFDYRDIAINNTSSTSIAGSPWDVSPWDVSPWSTESLISDRWRVVGGTGYAFGIRLKGTTRANLQWLRTDLRFEAGNDL